MKFVITVLIIIGAYLGIKSIFTQYKKEVDLETGKKPATQTVTVEVLPGLPDQFEPSLATAQAQGAASLKAWLDKYRSYVRDPRLGGIELDYALLVSRTDPVEATHIFKAVKDRTPTTSPLYDRIKKLNSTFGQ